MLTSTALLSNSNRKQDVFILMLLGVEVNVDRLHMVVGDSYSFCVFF